MEIEEITEWNDERIIGQNTAYSNAITPEKIDTFFNAINRFIPNVDKLSLFEF